MAKKRKPAKRRKPAAKKLTGKKMAAAARKAITRTWKTAKVRKTKSGKIQVQVRTR